MCGICLFAGKEMDVPVMRRQLLRTEARRGGDAFGFAWLDGRGRLRHFKGVGRFADRQATLEVAWDARLFLGHLRWASRGAADDLACAHPWVCDGGFLAHNGTLAGARDLAAAHGLLTATACDSEVLAGLVEVAPGATPAARLAWALAAAGGDGGDGGGNLTPAGRGQLAVWLGRRPQQLVVGRAGNPLHWAKHPGGLYAASLAEDVYADGQRVWAFPDWEVTVLTVKGASNGGSKLAGAGGAEAHDGRVQGDGRRKGVPGGGGRAPARQHVRTPAPERGNGRRDCLFP